MKICIKCKIEKDDIEFYFIKSTKRFMSNCKLCEKQNTKERYDKNPEYFLSRNQRYFERNKNNIITQRKNGAKLQETKKKLSKTEKYRKYKIEYITKAKQLINELKKSRDQ